MESLNNEKLGHLVHPERLAVEAVSLALVGLLRNVGHPDLVIHLLGVVINKLLEDVTRHTAIELNNSLAIPKERLKGKVDVGGRPVLVNTSDSVEEVLITLVLCVVKQEGGDVGVNAVDEELGRAEVLGRERERNASLVGVLFIIVLLGG